MQQEVPQQQKLAMNQSKRPKPPWGHPIDFSLIAANIECERK